MKRNVVVSVPLFLLKFNCNKLRKLHMVLRVYGTDRRKVLHRIKLELIFNFNFEFKNIFCNETFRQRPMCKVALIYTYFDEWHTEYLLWSIFN